MKDMQRFKTRWEGTACQHALLLAPEMLTVMDPPTCQRGLPGKKSQLYLKPFGVGVPIVGLKLMPWPFCAQKQVEYL